MICPRSIHWIPAVLAAAFVGWSVGPLAAQLPAPKAEDSVVPIGRANPAGNWHPEIERLEAGNSSRLKKKEAIEQLPLSQLTAENQTVVREILKDVSLYRRLPTIKLEADRRVYDYFTRHPDVAVSVWRAMDISQVKMVRQGPQHFTVDTGDGTQGTVSVLHQSPHSHLILCQGEFLSPAIKRPIQARSIMHLQPSFSVNAQGVTEVVHTLDLFVCFPSQAIETVARIISPISNQIADRNFEEVSLFVELMDLGMSHQPGWVEQLSSRLDLVSRDAPEQLLQLTAHVYIDSQKRSVREVELPAEVAPTSPLRRFFLR